jgi:flagellar basal-body rod protein FlgC
MVDSLSGTLKIAASGLAAQSMRQQVAAENLANTNSTASAPGGNPYARKTITFDAELDSADGLNRVRVSEFGRSRAPFRLEFDPGHPGADDKGLVKLPNVNPLVELADMRESNRTYQANLQVVRQARELISMTIDLLKAT